MTWCRSVKPWWSSTRFRKVTAACTFRGLAGTLPTPSLRQRVRVRAAPTCPRLATALGDMCLALWQAEGVDVSAVAVRDDAPTGVYFVRHDLHGHHFSYLRRGSAASRMQPGDLSEDLIGNSWCLHVSGISQAISANACDTVSVAIALAHAAGTRVPWPEHTARRGGLGPSAGGQGGGFENGCARRIGL